ncbi:MAG: Fe-S cluster assembly protein SufD [Bdellovibrionaceae bacterium]|nr:Fe-S cluster assembly protein SufD [Bdellovibrionales bacterium]MCB9085299.1 Fe-S cluster assembly protein SufD [Pseudobdellovibrionaceae bacterium]
MQTSFDAILRFKKTYEVLKQDQRLIGTSDLSGLRESAMTRLEGRGFPGRKTEEWRYTNTAPLLQEHYVTPKKERSFDLSDSALAEMTATFDSSSYRVVLVNGHFVGGLSRLPEQSGVSCFSLAALVSGQGPMEIKSRLEMIWEAEEGTGGQAFTWLNSALCLDGCVLVVDPQTSVDKPIEVIHVQSGEGDHWQSSMCRNFFFIGAGSKATITEGFIGSPETRSLTNTVTSLRVGEGAKVYHFKVQLENPKSYHLSFVRASLAESADVRFLQVASGARISRQELCCDIVGPQAFVRADAIYLVEGQEHVDLRTEINHRFEGGSSHQLFKGIASDKARAVFNGKILISEGAQKVDSSQLNKTLLLSNTAEVDAKPELEIYADDVKATHGATVGQLDEEQVFYFVSRGIPPSQAETLLAQGFTGEVLDHYRDCGAIVSKLDLHISSWVDRNRTSGARG